MRELEAYVAAQLGKQAGLFVPSCTMANLLAVLAQTQRNEQVILESTAHMYTSERARHLHRRVLSLCAGRGRRHGLEPARRGAADRRDAPEDLAGGDGDHAHNAGGTVLPLDHMRSVYGMANSRGISVHLDGARMYNAAVALGVTPLDIAQHADTVSLCLSKA